MSEPARRLRLTLDRSTRVLAGGAAVLGGRPARLLRLSPIGSRLLVAWQRGDAVGSDPAARALADRLVRGGLAHPLPAAGTLSGDDVAVVVPARDRVDRLAGCLSRVGAVAELVVVDDGSRDPAALRAVADEHGARVLALSPGVGPAGARNAGLRVTRAPFVAFLDSDTRPRPGWLAPLLAHFEDPRTGAVAPRIAVPPGTSALAAYEAVRSPLDLGPSPGPVGPGRRIGYVPSAALVVRRAALADGGFDAGLRYGEDVDLVWRLDAAGWSIRYEPAARVEHPHRVGVRAWLGQRVAYGSSAGPLSRRHPGRIRHLTPAPTVLAPAALALIGQPRAALLTAAGATAWLVRRLPTVPGARRDLLAFASATELALARQLLDAGWRAYPPLVAVTAALAPRSRPPLAAGLLGVAVADWANRRPRLDPVRFAGLRAADDLAYATGLWLGCARSRTLGPLLPGRVREPPPQTPDART